MTQGGRHTVTHQQKRFVTESEDNSLSLWWYTAAQCSAYRTQTIYSTDRNSCTTSTSVLSFHIDPSFVQCARFRKLSHRYESIEERRPGRGSKPSSIEATSLSGCAPRFCRAVRRYTQLSLWPAINRLYENNEDKHKVGFAASIIHCSSF